MVEETSLFRPVPPYNAERREAAGKIARVHKLKRNR